MQERKRGTHRNVLGNPASEVTYHPFCCIPLAPQAHLDAVWERTAQGMNARGGITGGHLRDLLPYTVPSCGWTLMLGVSENTQLVRKTHILCHTAIRYLIFTSV